MQNRNSRNLKTAGNSTRRVKIGNIHTSTNEDLNQFADKTDKV